MTTNTSEDLFWINMLRVISTMAVVVLHVSAQVVLGVNDVQSISWWVGNFADASVRWCVPIFVMISGALLLDPLKDESTSFYLRKRSKRILIPLIFWTFFSFLFVAGVEEFSLKNMLLKISFGLPYAHLWYLYMIIGLYLITPFLRTYIRSSSSRERVQLVVFIMLCASITASFKFFLFGNVPSTIFTSFIPFIGYYLLGYQLRSMDKTKISLAFLWSTISISLFVIAFGTGFVTDKVGLEKGLFFYDYLSPPVIIMSISVFLLVSKNFSLNSWIQKKFYTIINIVTPLTLGIYVLHLFILDGPRMLFEISPASYNPVLSIPLFSLVVFTASCLLTLIMKKMPYLRRLL